MLRLLEKGVGLRVSRRAACCDGGADPYARLLTCQPRARAVDTQGGREMLSDFNMPQAAENRVYEDNLASVTASENSEWLKDSRHIEIRRYFVRELVLAGVVQLIPLRTDKMVANA